MVLHPRLAQFLAAVLLCAALLAPSLASAHGSHASHASHAHPAPVAVAQAAAGQSSGSAAIARMDIAAPALDDRRDGGCARHCCNGTASMACCTAALVPEVALAPSFTGAQPFRLARAGALLGVPPEALPKPPKSNA